MRVDFFLANNTYCFAELTFTPSAGMIPFNPDKYDLEWGKMLNIESLIAKEGGVLLLVNFTAAQNEATFEERWCA